jgi:hypothetical protein
MSPHRAVQSLHSCQYLPLEGATFVPALRAMYGILNALLLHHTNTVYGAIPAFISCAKNILLFVLLPLYNCILLQTHTQVRKGIQVII